MGCAESRQNDDFFQRALKSGFLLKNDDVYLGCSQLLACLFFYEYDGVRLYMYTEV